ncbi:hypothetical protein [Halomonas sp. NO4]|nr:hypothetical protein [Halomonas sp. NO4]
MTAIALTLLLLGQGVTDTPDTTLACQPTAPVTTDRPERFVF